MVGLLHKLIQPECADYLSGVNTVASCMLSILTYYLGVLDGWMDIYIYVYMYM